MSDNGHYDVDRNSLGQDRRENSLRRRRGLGLHNIDGYIVHNAKANKHIGPHDRRGSFTEQKVELSKTPFLFFPEGFEKIFLGIYFISLPYIAGILFLFFYIADGQYDIFVSLDQQSSFILTWAIGYEILAVFTLLYIIKSAISFTREITRKGKRKEFHRP